MPGTSVIQDIHCHHCGELCKEEHIQAQEKHFCCQGCKMVYEIIDQNGLCDYYSIEKTPGINQKTKVREGKFEFLDNKEIAEKLIHFKEGSQSHITFYLPQMHCSSCIWLLEHLNTLNKAVVHSSVNFLKKEVTVIFNNDTLSLRALTELLTSIGYEPHISMRDMDSKRLKKYDKSRVYKIGIAGFCFGNIMLLSFPEYFSSGDIQETHLKDIFSYLNLALSLPVFFYCASEFFVSAYKSFRQKFLNIDAPIALAILITFGRSVIEILSHSGAGYLDSMSGIVFFMLIGRFFQDKTYQSLSFDRDYTSYFPIGVTRLNQDGAEEQVPVSEIKKGDRLRIHSHEIIPADGILFMGKAVIDYSFVTGESIPSEKGIGELVYAGGKQNGAAIEIEVIKEVSQSYLTQLWNNDVFKKAETEKRVSFVHKLSRYFTYILFSIAILAAVYWYFKDPSLIWHAVTSVLIVACPCALLLSATFTNGNMLSRLKKAGLYVKNANVLEGLSDIDMIVLDKTGTISIQTDAKIHFSGTLSAYEQQLIRTLSAQSNHPLSKAIAGALPLQKHLKIRNFIEIKGKGSSAFVNDEAVRLGSMEYVTGYTSPEPAKGSRIYVSVNSEVLGFFTVNTNYREGLQETINALQTLYKLAVISGDNDAERSYLKKLFGTADLRFGQSPQNKLDYIKCLQAAGKKVVMIGDGLNDAGALQQSNVGIVISDDINNFSPACDAILDGRQFSNIKKLIDYCRREKTIIYGSFIISILYNIAGLYFAVRGDLSPVIAAILMPVSSVSIVIYTTVMSSFMARKLASHAPGD